MRLVLMGQASALRPYCQPHTFDLHESLAGVYFGALRALVTPVSGSTLHRTDCRDTLLSFEVALQKASLNFPFVGSQVNPG